jgi:hypothetical protein
MGQTVIKNSSVRIFEASAAIGEIHPYLHGYLFSIGGKKDEIDFGFVLLGSSGVDFGGIRCGSDRLQL